MYATRYIQGGRGPITTHQKRCSWRMLALKPSAHHQRADAFAQYKLPNGFVIRHTSTPAEVEFLFDEVYCQQQYLQHGVSLKQGDTVLDVGANIGMFSLLAGEVVGPTGRVVSVEPAPQTAAALAINLQQHAALHNKQVAHSTVLPVAVTHDQAQPTLQFTVYTGAPGWSTLERDDAEVLRNMQVYLQSLLQEPPASGPTAASPQQQEAAIGVGSPPVVSIIPGGRGWSGSQRVLVWCARQLARTAMFRALAVFMASLYVRLVMLRGAETVTVATTTISNIIQEQHLQCINLLKVDVERAELQVLQGIQQQHWPLIHQVSMEVHDIDDRLAEVVSLLQRHGFNNVVCDQQAQLQGSNLYNLYATKTG